MKTIIKIHGKAGKKFTKKLEFFNIRKAGDAIIEGLIHHCNINGIDLASGREAQIQQGIDLGIAFVRTEQEALGE